MDTGHPKAEFAKSRRSALTLQRRVFLLLSSYELRHHESECVSRPRNRQAVHICASLLALLLSGLSRNVSCRHTSIDHRTSLCALQACRDVRGIGYADGATPRPPNSEVCRVSALADSSSLPSNASYSSLHVGWVMAPGSSCTHSYSPVGLADFRPSLRRRPPPPWHPPEPPFDRRVALSPPARCQAPARGA